jgi:hypothetical protein
MMTWRADYWRMFNVLVRVLGLTALVSGTVFTVLGISRIVQSGAIRIEGEPGLILLLVGLLSLAIGAAILRAPPFRPDLGDVSWRFDPFGSKEKRLARPKRSWWTGDGARAA